MRFFANLVMTSSRPRGHDWLRHAWWVRPRKSAESLGSVANQRQSHWWPAFFHGSSCWWMVHPLQALEMLRSMTGQSYDRHIYCHKLAHCTLSINHLWEVSQSSISNLRILQQKKQVLRIFGILPAQRNEKLQRVQANSNPCYIGMICGSITFQLSAQPASEITRTEGGKFSETNAYECV